MNGLYITFNDIEHMSGHKEKVLGQIDALSKITDQMYVLASNGSEYFFGEYLNCSIKKIKSVKISMRIKFVRGFINQIKFFSLLRTMLDQYDVNFAYIRRIIPLTTHILRSLRFMKKQEIRIFYEYPTYPWQEEMKNNPRTFGKLNYYLDKLNYKKLLNIVDYIPAIVACDELPSRVENEKFIRISNGISIEKLPVNLPVSHEGLNLIAVGHLQNYHGYDRVIDGISEFYNHGGKHYVRFLVVGGGSEFDNLKRMAKRLGVMDKVVFFGTKTGKELDMIFRQADVAVASIGNHRKGIYRDSALKSREYCARGIPFIMSSYDFDFPEEFRYVHRIPTDDSPVDIDSVLHFVSNIKHDDYIVSMRQYAEQRLNWESQMQPIIKKITSLVK